MGNAYVWYYPEGCSIVQAIDLGSRLSDLFERPDVLAFSSEAINGRQSTVIARSRLKVRITLERFSSSATERALRGAIGHLQRGGHIGVAGDVDKAWAGYTTTTPGYGITTLRTKGSPYWNRSAALAANDEVYISSPAPDSQEQLGVVSAFASPVVTLSSGLIRKFKAPVCVRHRDFFPMLYLPAEQRSREQLTSMRRLGWTWDVELVEDIDALHTLATVGTGFLAGTTAQTARLGIADILGRSVAAQATMGMVPPVERPVFRGSR